MAPGVSLDKFCKDVNIKVTGGVTTGMIRPAGKKDVTVTIDGLDFNTPDGFVIDYLNKFGVVLTNAVVYTKYDSGPLKGKFNGERKFQVDFSKSARQMGTYHLIDGSKVRGSIEATIKHVAAATKLQETVPEKLLLGTVLLVVVCEYFYRTI